MQTLGKKILSFRKSKHWTQEALAQELGVSPQSVSKWENDITMPDITLLPKIALLFGTTLDNLFSMDTLRSQKKDPGYIPLYTYKNCFKEIDAHLNRDVDACVEKILTEEEGSTCGYLSYRAGTVFIDQNIALVDKKSDAEALEIMDDEEVEDVLEFLADRRVRQIIKLLYENPYKGFTVESLATKFCMTTEETEEVIEKIHKHMFIERKHVEISNGQTSKVYSTYMSFWVRLVMLPILSLAKKLYKPRDKWAWLETPRPMR